MLPLSLALVLLALLISPAAAEEKSACSLLTSSDIEAVLGGKPSGYKLAYSARQSPSITPLFLLLV